MYRVVETACPARPQLPAAPGATSRLAHAPFIRNMSSVIALLLEFQVVFWKHSRCACVRQDHLLSRIPFWISPPSIPFFKTILNFSPNVDGILSLGVPPRIPQDSISVN